MLLMYFVLIELSLQPNCSTPLSSSYVLWCLFLTHIAKGQQPCREAVLATTKTISQQGLDKTKKVNIKSRWVFTVFQLLFDNQWGYPVFFVTWVVCFYCVTADRFNTYFFLTMLLLFLTSLLALVLSSPIAITIIVLANTVYGITSNSFIFSGAGGSS